MSQPDFDARAASWDDDPRKRARAEAVANAIVRRIELGDAPRTLEYGAGTGLLSFALADRLGETVLADTSDGMLEEARRKISRFGAQRFSALKLDLATDPPPQIKFDLLCSMMVLHHIPDTAAILRAFRASLVKGGWIAIADLDAEDGSFHGLDVDVHHGFDRTELARHAAEAGFEDVTIETCFEMPRGERKYSVFLMTGRAG